MAEKNVGEKLKKNLDEFEIEILDDKYGRGTPDRLLVQKNIGTIIFVELKYIKSLPQRNCKVGLKLKQAAFLTRLVKNKANGFLLVGVGSDKVALFSSNFNFIARSGISRNEFVLIEYNKIEAALKASVEKNEYKK